MDHDEVKPVSEELTSDACLEPEIPQTADEGCVDQGQADEAWEDQEQAEEDGWKQENLGNSRGKGAEIRSRRKSSGQVSARKEEAYGRTIKDLEKNKSIFRKNDALWAAF